jgi:geranylgeranyl pyrophosphate synthase
VNALVTVGDAPGLDSYLDALEERLATTVRSHSGTVAAVGVEALAAGGKRLRPLLVFLASPPERPPPLAAGVAVELVHMATLVHDDVIDGAEFRRGRPSAWSAFGSQAAQATGDYLFARAFAELAESGDAHAVAILARTALALARGEALQRRQAFRPDTSVEDYLARCTLKTGKLFEAACLLGGGGPELGRFGLALGVAFQIVDDILDCTGTPGVTGKAPGVDLRDGTPTLPLILAARADARVRRALAGEDVPDALAHVPGTGALEAARELALEYAERARAALDGEPDRESLEALARLVVERET